MKALTYFQEHSDYFVDQLGELVAFKSISTDPQYKDQVLQASAWLQRKLESLGFQVQVVATDANPVLIADRQEGSKLPTVLLYGHYDVQPVEPIVDWQSDPFVLTRKDEQVLRPRHHG